MQIDDNGIFSICIKGNRKMIRKIDAHDLNSPLSVACNVAATIGLLADLYDAIGIARNDIEAEKLARALNLIESEAIRVTSLLGDLMR